MRNKTRVAGTIPAMDVEEERMAEVRSGGCLCGAVRYEITAPFLSAGYCHCTRCQRRTGTSASSNAIPASGSLRVVRGEDRLRAWQPEGGNEKLFCADCGSARRLITVRSW